MYSMDGRVRYSEVDFRQDMTFASLLNYFQDCCIFQSEDLGIGLNVLGEMKNAWVLISWQVVLVKKPKLGERIKINTWPYDFGGFYGYRNFTLTDESGEVAAYANSVWAFMDLENARPTKIAEHVLEAYSMEPQYPMEYAERKVRMPKGAAAAEPFAVHASQIDTNQHVNNEKYVEMAQEYLPEGFEIGQMRAEYKKSAVLGDWVHPYVCCGGTGAVVTVELADEMNKAYATIEFQKK